MESRDVTKKDIFLAIGVVGSILSTVVLSLAGYSLAAGLMMSVMALWVIYSFFKMPWKELGKIEFEREQNIRKTRFGPLRIFFKRIGDYFSLVFVGIYILGIGLWLYNWLLTNGS